MGGGGRNSPPLKLYLTKQPNQDKIKEIVDILKAVFPQIILSRGGVKIYKKKTFSVYIILC